jgi:hypothetical protein
LPNQQQAPQPPPLTTGTVARSLLQQPGGLEQHVKASTEQHQVAGKGIFLSEQGMGKVNKE